MLLADEAAGQPGVEQSLVDEPDRRAFLAADNIKAALAYAAQEADHAGD